MKMLKKVFNCEIKAIDVAERTLTAYVSTGARDRMDEVLSPEGVDFKMFKKNPVVLFAHNYTQPPIAKALWIKRDGDGIISKMKFAETEFASEVFNLYKDGFMKAFSVGFISRERKYGEGKEDPRVTYLKWELLEYSAVPVPANPEALALAISKGVLKDKGLKSQLGENDTTTLGQNQKTEPWCCCGDKGIKEDPFKDGQQRTCDVCKMPIKSIPPPKKKEKTNAELLSEVTRLEKDNKTLQSDLFNANTTILGLRYDLLQINKPNKEKTLSEMTDGAILKTIEETVIGVIRKITGKVT